MVDRKAADLEYLMKELSIAKEQGDRKREGTALGNMGIAYYRLGDFEKAIEYYTQFLSIAKELGDRAGERTASNNLGAAYRGQGDFKQAIEHYKQSLNIAKELGDRAKEGKASYKLGIVNYDLGNLKQAIQYYKQSINIFKELGDRAGEGEASNNLGIAYHGLGDLKQAIEYWKQGLNIAKELGYRAGEKTASNNLGVAYLGQGDFKQAIEHYKQSLNIAKELGDRAEEGEASYKLGEAYYSLCDIKQAIGYYKQSLTIFKELRERAREGHAYQNLGVAYYRLGNSKEAIGCHNQHLSIAKELGRVEEGKANGNVGEAYCRYMGIACCNLGGAYSQLGYSNLAKHYHEQALKIAEELGDRMGEVVCHASLGQDYKILKDLQNAKAHLEKCLSISIEVGNRDHEGKAYVFLGRIHFDLGDYEQAKEYHNKVLSIAKEVKDREDEGLAYDGLGKVYRELGNFKQATEYFKRYLSISKETGNRFGEAMACFSVGYCYELSASFSEALDYYRSSVRFLNDTRNLLESEDAWKITFRDRHRCVYTALWRILVKTGKTDEALCAAEQGRAQALIDVLKTQYGMDLPSTPSLEPKETISYISNDFTTQTVFLALDCHRDIISFWFLAKGREIFFTRLKIIHGDPAFLVETALKEIRAGVDVRCEDRSMDEPSDDQPTNRVNREAVEEDEQSRTSTVNSLRPLYDVIIGPIADLLQGDQLIVVPDGPFCLAPYSALSETIRIRIAPSLTALKLITGSPEDFHCKSGALLVGDPCLEELTDPFGRPIWNPLPCAKEEVEMIGKLLKTTPLTGRDATKDEVLKRLTSVAVVHIAAHGCAQSGEILLAPNPDRTSQGIRRQDYILTMSDVQAACLRARLVVLSCCHSGKGEIKSEGVVGIARSFLCAGARSVLVSLWAIDDEATMVFMESFYQHLADGKSASVALHQAMKLLRETEQFSAPKYWAPFVLIGDDITLEFGEQDKQDGK